MDAITRALAIAEDLGRAHADFKAECARITRDYGPKASTRPAYAAFAATLDRLAGAMEPAYAEAHHEYAAALRGQRLAYSTQEGYRRYPISLAAHAAILPSLSDAQLQDRLSEAVEDGRTADAAAMLELCGIRIAKPSRALVALMGRAEELSVPDGIKSAERWLRQLEDAYRTFNVRLVSYRAELASVLDPASA